MNQILLVTGLDAWKVFGNLDEPRIEIDDSQICNVRMMEAVFAWKIDCIVEGD